jgi:copper homeostasis protein (lipoprotein)
MNKWLIGLLAVAVLLSAGLFIVAGQKPPSLTFVGTLPGADCAGLKTELTLYQDHTYFLRETYLATRDGDKTFTSSGTWQKLRPGKYDVIQLNPDKPEEKYNFLITDADHLLVVGKEMRPIPTPMNLTLTRQK